MSSMLRWWLALWPSSLDSILTEVGWCKRFELDCPALSQWEVVPSCVCQRLSASVSWQQHISAAASLLFWEVWCFSSKQQHTEQEKGKQTVSCLICSDNTGRMCCVFRVNPFYICSWLFSDVWPVCFVPGWDDTVVPRVQSCKQMPHADKPTNRVCIHS